MTERELFCDKIMILTMIIISSYKGAFLTSSRLSNETVTMLDKEIILHT